MRISLCSLALLSFSIFSIRNHNAYPCTNLSQIQQSVSTWSSIMTYYHPASNKSMTPTSWSKFLTYDTFINQSSTSQSKPLAYDNFIEKSSPHFKEFIVTSNSFTGKTTTLLPLNQKYRNRYNFKHRFRNPIVTISSPLMATSYRRFQRYTKVEKILAPVKSNNVRKAIQDYAYIKTVLNSTPMVYVNITVPQAILQGKVSRLASPYIIRITLPRKHAPRSNATLPNRGFLRIVGSKINMLEEGNLGLIIGKIANQIGNAYNMSGKDIQGMRHVIVVGPGGQMINRRATPPKKTTVLTSPMMMTARVRLRLNCTLPKITDQIIYFDDYTKYFELY